MERETEMCGVASTVESFSYYSGNRLHVRAMYSIYRYTTLHMQRKGAENTTICWFLPFLYLVRYTTGRGRGNRLGNRVEIDFPSSFLNILNLK